MHDESVTQSFLEEESGCETNMNSSANPLYLLGSSEEETVSSAIRREDSLAPLEIVERSKFTHPLNTCDRVSLPSLG